MADFTHPVANTPDNLAQKIFTLNFFSPLALTRESLPHIRKVKGNIVFISSVVGKTIKEIISFSIYIKIRKHYLLQFKLLHRVWECTVPQRLQ